MPGPTPPATTAQRPFVGLLLLCVAVVLLTAHRFDNALVWDDPVLVDAVERAADEGRLLGLLWSGLVDTSLEEDRSGEIDFYRPMAMWSLALNAALGGRAPFGYHALNLLLHLLNVTLLWQFGRRLLPEASATARTIGVGLFALGPQIATAHVWISGRFDLLATTFALGAVLLWRRGDGGWPRQLGTGLCFLAALLSKEPVLGCVPGLWWLVGGPAAERARRLAPFAVAAIAYVPLRLTALSGTGAGAQLQGAQLWTALKNLPLLWVDGLVGVLVPQRVYPRNLVEDYRGMSVALSLAALSLVVALGVLAFRQRRSHPIPVVAFVWFLCTLAPVATVTTRMWPGFGRFLYLPAALLCVGVVALLQRGLSSLDARGESGARLRSLARAAGAAYVAILGLRSAAYVLDFQDDATLFSSIIAAAPERAHGYGLLGMKAIGHDAYPQAVKLLQRAVALDPHERRYAKNLAEAQIGARDLPGAAATAERALRTRPDDLGLHLLASLAQLTIEPTLAAEHALACLRINPRHPECLRIVDLLHGPRGRDPDARALIEQRLSEPDMRPAAEALGLR